MGCKLCELNIHSSPTGLRGSGNKKSDIMVINSYATDEDEQAGEAVPGKNLQKFLTDIGIKDYYYTNAIKCRVPKGTKIKVTCIKKCKVYLEKEIKIVKPKFILVIGSQALKALSEDKITQTCGVVKEGPGYKYIATYSPGIIFRDPSKYDYVVQAFNNFKSLVSGNEIKLPELEPKIVKSKKGIDRALNKLGRYVSFDIETTGLDRFTDKINLIGFGDNKHQYILPVNVKYSPIGNKPKLKMMLPRYLIRRLNESKKLVEQNGKFDNLFCELHFGIKPHNSFDTMLASYILDENSPNGLKENAVLHCNALDWDIDKKLKTGNVKTHKDYKNYCQYLAYDVYYTFKLYKKFKRQLREDKSISLLFKHLYMPGSWAYEDVQSHGVWINPKQFKEVSKYLNGELSKVLKKLNKFKKINWSSTNQIKKYFYNDLKLPILDLTAAGEPSTGESTIQRLGQTKEIQRIMKRRKWKHNPCELLLQYRGIKIQITHFVDGWRKRMHNGRLYPNFKLHGTVTGRTSSNNPNLQQVPRAKVIRSLVSAPDGKCFVEADLSQAELRIAALISGDDTMIRTYRTGGDIHNSTYNAISGGDLIEEETDPAVKKEKRKKAKAVNFGFLYGMGWRKFKDYARDNYGIILTDKEAQETRERFFQMYSALPEWHKKQRKIVHALKQVRSPIGRIRRLPDIDSSDKGKVAEAERQSINSPVQGLGSDITVCGLIEIMGHSNINNDLDRSKFSVVGTVHDSILFEVDLDYVETLSLKVKKIVEDSKTLQKYFKFDPSVPIIMDVAVGKSWGNCVELDFDGDWRKQIKDVLK